MTIHPPVTLMASASHTPTCANQPTLHPRTPAPPQGLCQPADVGGRAPADVQLGAGPAAPPRHHAQASPGRAHGRRVRAHAPDHGPCRGGVLRVGRGVGAGACRGGRMRARECASCVCVRVHVRRHQAMAAIFSVLLLPPCPPLLAQRAVKGVCTGYMLLCKPPPGQRHPHRRAQQAPVKHTPSLTPPGPPSSHGARSRATASTSACMRSCTATWSPSSTARRAASSFWTSTWQRCAACARCVRVCASSCVRKFA